MIVMLMQCACPSPLPILVAVIPLPFTPMRDPAFAPARAGTSPRFGSLGPQPMAMHPVVGPVFFVCHALWSVPRTWYVFL
jgi:hypothetical protein